MGQYCNSLAAVQELVANSELTAIGSDTGAPSISSMDKSRLEYYPMPRKGLRMLATLEESMAEDKRTASSSLNFLCLRQQLPFGPLINRVINTWSVT